jgi:ribonuclease HIII
MASSKPKTMYVCEMTAYQVSQLHELLSPAGWTFDDLSYGHWRASRDKTTVAAYTSGKVVVQGKGTADVVQFVIEPEILKEVRFGYENELARVETPDMFEPHAGVDESGKGDYFGPLVIAAVYTEQRTAQQLLDLGVTDSKKIKSDVKIAKLADQARGIVRGRFSIVPIGPDAYNRMYEKMRNVNRMLAWGHARAIENLLEKVGDCPRALSDKFANEREIKRALMEKGRRIELQQRTKAESDIAVAAASILARDEFVRRLKRLGEDAGMELPKGAGEPVLKAGHRLAFEQGREVFARFAKLHFRTTQKIVGSS